ncbi:1-(5-phosphoribosyl)-5-[(5-phosphoribosylamino)methylideneamino]imidazole-4-carboxamide isomerase [Bellilinea sp.]|jgi:phosphoribosylformimino-5-aminoimidazole carboxamide ribotide isomerase|uniref:1-(5-phosphoribosyl)-5-[(5-phosphoribosylamino)methylideneamino] imidazole-4-carboxamide isomerase n=1 Tax=Bellilinea caldifistulae TaxID=360411 RepID=A0A7C4Q0V4_9CHLR|nr:1-(5-phosphoribosyl)-5-[(5-phosphoribosylamino)methylideneamino] imidazole-4-carboxamide isomerase [Bellilinea sp.]
MEDFTIFPAIDLRGGKVVRLEEGDPSRQTVFSNDPAEVADRFLKAGARWLHVINLDGAFGDTQQARQNERAIARILEITSSLEAHIQVGGGLRTIGAIRDLLDLGVQRVILGTLAVEQPQAVADAIRQWGADRIAVSVDLRAGIMQTHGWQKSALLPLEEWLQGLADEGLRWVMITDVERDGMLSGANPQMADWLKADSRLRLVLAGGVSRKADIQAARTAGLAGVIIGRALYTGELNLSELLREVSDAG